MQDTFGRARADADRGAIGRQVSRLEAFLGDTLFERVGNRVRLAPSVRYAEGERVIKGGCAAQGVDGKGGVACCFFHVAEVATTSACGRSSQILAIRPMHGGHDRARLSTWAKIRPLSR